MKKNKISELAEKAKNLTTSPGTYLMKNSGGEIIYIGKAKNLRNRVSSYFVLSDHTPKTEKMVSHVNDFDIIITKSEYEALLLECKLIKKYSPKYNILLKDDKGFSYINISEDDFPKISVSHNAGADSKNSKSQKSGTDGKNATAKNSPSNKSGTDGKNSQSKKTLGPFITSYSITRIVGETNRIFKLRTCKNITLGKSCIYHEIGTCSAPCVGKISKEDYSRTIGEAIEFIKKGYAFEIDDMQKEMQRLSDRLEFEKAAVLRDRIYAIKKWKEVKIDNDVDNLVFLEELREILKLKDLPRIIEAVDISNLGDENIVGCVVAYKNGEKDKANYRKYKVKTISSQDDFGSMGEVVGRHFSHKETYPQIFFLDGPYREYELPCPVFGLIKNDKHKFRGIDTGEFIIEDISKELRNFLTAVSDEVHRFTINYMRKLKRNNDV